MEEITICNSFRKFFAMMLAIINILFVFFMIFSSEVTFKEEMIFSILNLVLVIGLFIKIPLLKINEYGLTIKNGEEIYWNEILDIQVGRIHKNRTFHEKIWNPFAPYGATKNYYLNVNLLEEGPIPNVLDGCRLNLNFSDMDPYAIDELLRYATIGTKVIMYRDIDE